MNEANSVINPPTPPVTTAWVLPILQEQVNVNDILATVIKYVMALSYHMGQKHTIITAYQPLYSRGEILVWTNHKFESGIFIMGGLHICLNFFKSIVQHMDTP